MNDNESPPNRGGRPRAVGEPLERVSTRLPVSYFNRLTQLANQRDTSVSSLVRQLLILRIPKDGS